MTSQPTPQQAEGPIVTNLVSSNEILESIQSIAKVMQQQLFVQQQDSQAGYHTECQPFPRG